MKGFDAQFKDFPDYILKITYQIWEKNDVEAIRDYYACLLYTSDAADE